MEIRAGGRRKFEVGRDPTEERVLESGSARRPFPGDFKSFMREGKSVKADRVLLDTNVLLYALKGGDRRAGAALPARGGVVQGLGEFAEVRIRKLRAPWVLRARRICELCPPPAPVTVESRQGAPGIVQPHGYGMHDAPLIAAAHQASSHTLSTEDLRRGPHIEGLVIRRESGGAP